MPLIKAKMRNKLSPVSLHSRGTTSSSYTYVRTVGGQSENPTNLTFCFISGHPLGVWTTMFFGGTRQNRDRFVDVLMINKITSIRIGFVDVDIIQNVSFLNAYIHERDLEKISVESIGARIWAFFNRGPLGYGNKRWTYPIPSVYCASLCNITSTRIPLTLHIYMPLQRINVSTLLGCVMRTNK